MISVAKTLDLLHNDRRRYTLYHLQEQDGPVHIDNIVEAVAEMEADAAEKESDGDLKDIELSLYHQHLPKTQPLEFIYYNKDEQTIQLTDEPTKFDMLLTVAKVLEQPNGQ